MSWKRLAWAVAVLVLTALVGLFIYIRTENNRAFQEAATQQQIIRSVVVQMIDSRDDLAVESLVIGSQVEPRFYDFRGAIKDGSMSVPLYGMVELTCLQLSAELSCWDLVLLERDGNAMPLSVLPNDEPDEAVAPDVDEALTSWDASDEAAMDQAAVAELEPEDEAELELEAESDDGDAPAAEEDVEPDPGFVVINDRVNGRAGPGTDHEVVTSISPERRLILLEAEGEWGRYRFQTPAEGDASAFWVWMNLVKPAQEGP